MTKTEMDFLRALLRQAEAKKRRVSLAPSTLRRLLEAVAKCEAVR